MQKVQRDSNGKRLISEREYMSVRSSIGISRKSSVRLNCGSSETLRRLSQSSGEDCEKNMIRSLMRIHLSDPHVIAKPLRSRGQVQCSKGLGNSSTSVAL